MKRSVLVLFAVLQFAATSTVLADPTCLIGKWQAVEETINVDSASTRALAGDRPAHDWLAGDWSVSGDVSFEILPSGDVRFVYDDYVARRKQQRGNLEILLEVRYHGETDGGISLGDGMTSLSLGASGKVARSMRQKIVGQDWAGADEEGEKPPHSQNDYAFACDGDELTLSKSKKGPFGGDYNGRFVRVN